MMMMTQNKMVSSVTDHHEMAPNAWVQTHGECSAVNLRCRITLWPFGDLLSKNNLHAKIVEMGYFTIILCC